LKIDGWPARTIKLPFRKLNSIYASSWALVRGGQIKLIGVASEKRLTQFPDVPTVSESGLLLSARSARRYVI
jgi:tripartite-type tricarboxylate transporter receptor subunit TctC